MLTGDDRSCHAMIPYVARSPIAYQNLPNYFPTTSIGTVMVFGGMQAFWSHA